MEYMLIYAEKDSYDRPIEISLQKESHDIKELSEEIYRYIYNSDLMENNYAKIKKAMKHGEKYIESGYEYFYIDYDTDNNLTYFSVGCPADDEYEGFSLKICEIKNDVKQDYLKSQIKIRNILIKNIKKLVSEAKDNIESGRIPTEARLGYILRLIELFDERFSNKEN